MKRFFKILGVLAVLALMGLGAIWGIFLWVASDLPQINSLADYRPPSNSRILARDGQVLLDIGKETRNVVPFKEIPKLVVNAFLAAEDDNFWQHKGVDYLGIARAFMVNLKEGRLVQGGSTITQQVAKSLLLSKERTLSRKVKDLLLAQQMEEKFSKEDILFLYLNQVYLGGGYYGVKAAFKGYFDKELKQATIAESALVAGLLVAPGRYSPYVNPRYAKMRQQYVLKRMHDTHMISTEEYEAAKTEEIKMRLRETVGMKGGHFTDWVRQMVMEEVGADEFLTQGFEVITTLDLNLQKQAEDSLLRHIKELDKRHGFKGPLAHFSDEEEIQQELQRQRQRIYRATSSFFHFTTKGENSFEFRAADDENAQLDNWFKAEEERLNPRFRSSVVVGNTSEDRLLPLLVKDKSYQAVVIKVDDAQRIAYATIGGARIIIPESGFSWAHSRQTDEETRWHPPVTKPSTLFKPGDQILIKVTADNQSLWPFLHSDYRKKCTDVALAKLLHGQKFIVGELDQAPEAEGALVALNPHSGQILAMVGGIDFAKSQFNRALQAARQPGSSFKPFIYAAALEEGYTPSTLLLDSPQALGGVDESLSWKPRNYDGEFLGLMTFRKALEISRNIPTIRILQDVGVDKITQFVHRLGMPVDLPKDMSIGLGSFGISLTELVKGYAIFANGGRRISAQAVTSIKDRTGKSYTIASAMNKVPEASSSPSKVEDGEPATIDTNIWRQNLDGAQVYDKRLAYVMTSLLRGVVQNGTAAPAKILSSNLAGKTGTTNNFVDALFVGYSESVVAATWVGLDDNRSLGNGESGGKTALPIWMDFMKLALQKYGAPEFPVPEGILNIPVNRETGRPAKTGETNVFMETFAVGMNPSSTPASSSSPSGEVDPEKPAALDDEGYFKNQ